MLLCDWQEMWWQYQHVLHDAGEGSVEHPWLGPCPQGEQDDSMGIAGFILLVGTIIATARHSSTPIMELRLFNAIATPF